MNLRGARTCSSAARSISLAKLGRRYLNSKLDSSTPVSGWAAQDNAGSIKLLVDLDSIPDLKSDSRAGLESASFAIDLPVQDTEV